MALGLRQKIQSNFSKSRLNDLLAARMSLPTMKFYNSSIPFYVQEGFGIKAFDEDFVISVPFPNFIRKQEVSKYRPWEVFDFVKRKRLNYIDLLLSTRRRVRRDKRKREKGAIEVDYGTDAELRRILNGEYDNKI